MTFRALLFSCALLVTSCSTPRPGEPAGVSAEHRELAERELIVGFLAVDGVYNSELVAPLDILHHTVFHVEPGMKVLTVAPSLEPITSFEGLRILPDESYASCPPLDVLVVPSAEHSMDSDLEDERMLEFVRRQGGAASFVMSLCDGAFVLAQAGLLDGKVATTFPADVAAMREMFPSVEVLEDVSFVHDGKALTSVGGAPSYDPALYLCELLYGAEKARGIARGLVIDWNVDEIAHVVR